MDTQKEWYDNKQLFEQIISMKDDFRDLREEMRETRTIIKQYNGLREEVGKVREEIDIVDDKVEEMKSVNKGKATVGNAIVKYGGWLVAIASLMIKLIIGF